MGKCGNCEPNCITADIMLGRYVSLYFYSDLNCSVKIVNPELKILYFRITELILTYKILCEEVWNYLHYTTLFAGLAVLRM